MIIKSNNTIEPKNICKFRSIKCIKNLCTFHDVDINMLLCKSLHYLMQASAPHSSIYFGKVYMLISLYFHIFTLLNFNNALFTTQLLYFGTQKEQK